MDRPAYAWLALATAIAFAAGAAGADVLITEIMANPAGDEHSGEWIELYNTGPGGADLEGWFIGVEYDGEYYLDAMHFAGSHRAVNPGAYALVVDPDCVADTGLCIEVPDGVTVFTIESGGFGRYGITNGGGTVRLARSTIIPVVVGATVDEAAYPGDAVVEGFSIERVNYSRSGLDPGNWSTSHVVGGTPGAPNHVGRELPAKVALRIGPDIPTDHVTIAVELPAAPVRLTVSVFDRHGRLVRRIADGAQRTAFVDFVWDGRDEHGTPMTTGPYIVRVEAVATETRRAYRATKRAIIAR